MPHDTRPGSWPYKPAWGFCRTFSTGDLHGSTSTDGTPHRNDVSSSEPAPVLRLIGRQSRWRRCNSPLALAYLARRHAFNIVGPLTLARSGNGFFEYEPHTRYQRYGVEPLNPYGLGPFCKFKVDGLPAGPGLYVLVVDGVPVYVGKTVNFKGRMGPVNYGLISPKNCYRTGQSTNCKINSRVLEAVKAGRYVAVYVHQTSNLDLEDVVISTVQPRWNGRHGSR